MSHSRKDKSACGSSISVVDLSTKKSPRETLRDFFKEKALRFAVYMNKHTRNEFASETADLLAVETDNTVDNRVEGIVFTATNVGSWVIFGTTLTNDNVACFNLLITVDLDSQAF